MVTPDEVPAGAVGLSIQFAPQRPSDAERQHARHAVSGCGDHRPAHRVPDLEAGDVIVMGTPAGVGYARKPPVWMKQGDTCEIEIEGIGVLSNPIRDEVV